MPKVLIAHGNTQRLKRAVAELQAAGFEVTPTPDGGDAFARFFEETPDLVLCSAALPGLSGVNFARMVRSQSPETPVVVLAESPSECDAEELTVLGDPLDIDLLRHAFPGIVPPPAEKTEPEATPASAADVFTLAAIKRFQRGSSIFALLDDEGIARIARGAKQRVCQDGDQIIRQGDPGDGFYLVVEGQVRVTLRERDDAEVARISEGGYFGEMALLSDQVRSASVWSMGTTTLLWFARSDFVPLLDDYPMLRELLSGVALERSEENLWSVLFADDEVQASIAELGETPAGASVAAVRPAKAADAAPPAESAPIATNEADAAAPPEGDAVGLEAATAELEDSLEVDLRFEGLETPGPEAPQEEAEAPREPAGDEGGVAAEGLSRPQPSSLGPLDAALVDLRADESTGSVAERAPASPVPSSLDEAVASAAESSRPTVSTPASNAAAPRGSLGDVMYALRLAWTTRTLAPIPGSVLGAAIGLGVGAFVGIAIGALVASGSGAPAEEATDAAPAEGTTDAAESPREAATTHEAMAAAVAAARDSQEPSANKTKEPEPARAGEKDAAARASAPSAPAKADKPAAKEAAKSALSEAERKELRKELFARYKARDYAGAIEAGQRLRGAPDLDWEAAFTIAQAERAGGRNDDALASYLDFAARYPANSFSDDAEFWAADILMSKGKKQEAKALLLKVVANPKTDFKTAAEARLKKL